MNARVTKPWDWRRYTSPQGPLQIFCSFLLICTLISKWSGKREGHFYSILCLHVVPLLYLRLDLLYLRLEPFHVLLCVYKDYNIDCRQKQRCYVNCIVYLTLSGDNWSSIIIILCGTYFDGNADPTSHSSGGNNCKQVYEHLKLITKIIMNCRQKLWFNSFPEQWWNYM